MESKIIYLEHLNVYVLETFDGEVYEYYFRHAEDNDFKYEFGVMSRFTKEALNSWAEGNFMEYNGRIFVEGV